MPKQIKSKICICGKEFVPYNSLVKVCSVRCAIKLSKEKTKEKSAKLTKLSGKDEERLRRKADALFQQAGKRLHLKSIVSDNPTEVIHHRIRKSESNNLRYYLPNGVPLTNQEHDQIHKTGDTSIELQIDLNMGVAWMQDLNEKRRIICKLTESYLENKIKELQQ